MALISKRNIRRVKVFLVSPWLEKLLITSYLVAFIGIILLRGVFLESSEVVFREKDISDLLKVSLSQVTTQTDYIDWLITNIPSFFITPRFSTFRIFGNMRLYQMRVDVPDDCFSKSFSNMELYETSFTSLCNPIMNSATLEYSIPVQNQALCNSDNCQDFSATQDDSFDVESSYVSYPSTAFVFELQRGNTTAFQQKLTNVKSNGWLHEHKTKALVFEIVLIEPQTKTIVFYRIQFENFAPGMYQTNLIKNFFAIYNRESFWNFFTAFLFLVNGILFFLKNGFEFGIQENKYVHVMEIGAAGLQIFLSTCILINVARFETFFEDKDLLQLAKQNRFFALQPYVSVINMENIVFMIMLFILPFKVFSFITWFKYMQNLQKLSSAIYRTLPSFVLCLVIVVVLNLLWAFIFYNILGNFSGKFEDYPNSILHFIFYEINDEVMGTSYKDTINLPLNFDISFFYLLMTLMRYSLLIFFLSVIVEAYYRSASFEFHQQNNYELEDIQFVSEMIRKIERFSKESLPQSDNAGKNNVNRKMLVWLSLSSNDDDNSNMMDAIYNKLEDNNIHLVQFYSLKEVIQFLKYLFGLKPNLLHKSANQFRIVIDNNIRGEEERDKPEKFQQQLEQPLELERIETLLEWLKFIGSRVPLMMYSRSKLKYEIMLRMRLKYNLLYFSTSVSNLTKFAIMQNLEDIMEAHERDESMSIPESLGLGEIDTSNIED